jgi:hypothetical protein
MRFLAHLLIGLAFLGLASALTCAAVRDCDRRGGTYRYDWFAGRYACGPKTP